METGTETVVYTWMHTQKMIVKKVRDRQERGLVTPQKSGNEHRVKGHLAAKLNNAYKRNISDIAMSKIPKKKKQKNTYR